MSKDIICEVHQTADGYSIYCPSKKSDEDSHYCSLGAWWGDYYPYGRGWHKVFYRKTYTFKCFAIMKAKALEEKMNAARREDERRRNFVEKKVWR